MMIFCANAISDVLFKGLPTKYMHCFQPRVICDLRPITCILLVPNIKMGYKYCGITLGIGCTVLFQAN